MKKKTLIWIGICIAIAAVVLWRWLPHRSPFYHGNGRIRLPVVQVHNNQFKMAMREYRVNPKQDVVAEALRKLLSDGGTLSPFPAGTRLLDLQVQNGIAYVNFSSEFNQIRENGDTTESLAQNTLRKTLAQFEQIKAMRIMVDGKPFEGEHSDWSQPIPVRNSNGHITQGANAG